METINANNFTTNPVLKQEVQPTNDLKNILVEYVGEETNPEDKNVTVEMVIEVMAAQFPEFVLALAEENWVRGYQQALDDVEVGKSMTKEKSIEKKSCKLCEE
jgi:hypothetical protein